MITESTFPARGVRVTILRPYPEPILETYLSEDDNEDVDAGCVVYESQFSAGHKVVVHAEAVLARTETSGIYVRAFASGEDWEAEKEARWLVHVPPFVDGMFAEAEIFDDDGDDLDDDDVYHASLATIMGIGTEVLHRLHGVEGSLLTGTHELDIHIEIGQQNAFARVGDIAIGSVDARDKKFILAHEMGHWLQHQVTGGDAWALDYDYGPQQPPEGEDPDDPWMSVTGNPVNDACRFSVVGNVQASSVNPNRHGIRSAEFSSGSMPEGFGHFVASVAFNEPDQEFSGIFKYYKDIDEMAFSDYVDFEDPTHPGEISLAGGEAEETLGGRSRWTQTMCSEDQVVELPSGSLEVSDWDWPIDGVPTGQEVTTEIDWLRLFWQLHHGPYSGEGAPPTFWQVVKLVTHTQLTNPWSATVVFPHLDESVDDTEVGLSQDQIAWFRELSEAAPGGNGVFNEPP